VLTVNSYSTLQSTFKRTKRRRKNVVSLN